MPPTCRLRPGQARVTEHLFKTRFHFRAIERRRSGDEDIRLHEWRVRLLTGNLPVRHVDE
ncbi:MAG: hypothetical protein JWO87_2652 [Phycisphaerales bacterium]|nr:hypothetical protein [Phycisphaerales bacterium]